MGELDPAHRAAGNRPESVPRPAAHSQTLKREASGPRKRPLRL